MEIPWGQIFLWLHITIVAACAVRVLYKQHNIGTAFAWLIVLFVFPILGAGLYLLIGEPRLGTARAKRIFNRRASAANAASAGTANAPPSSPPARKCSRRNVSSA